MVQICLAEWACCFSSWTSSLDALTRWIMLEQRWKHTGSALCCTGRMDSPGVKSCQVTVVFVLVLLVAAAFGIIEQPSQRRHKKTRTFF